MLCSVSPCSVSIEVGCASLCAEVQVPCCRFCYVNCITCALS
ncbi:unnamed protein product [Haemonchus placei]|uniref:Uncharacterized protein n=1 Tax=Haemonchus placei TaxID=6290 RepID=A0A3P7SW10_HAEPC|nr:unnamed protein product [Haemonchus placei]